MAVIKKIEHGVALCRAGIRPADKKEIAQRESTMAYQILNAHNKGVEEGKFAISFDALISHDITYVGIIQSARASGMKEFPVPYALTNCHNSLCAVGGTINEDDHAFGLSAAKKYGGIYVPANQAVIHQFAREKLAGCGKMILGSDSHTRYGCYGTMGVGEGGGELVKQLLKDTWNIDAPEVVLVYVTGKMKKGVGPHDAALALVGNTFHDGFVKNRIMEFAGPGIADLSMDERIGIDVMTTETSCLSSIWITDEKVKEYYEKMGRSEEYKELKPRDNAYYDRAIILNLDELEAMIALPFHPSNIYTIHEFQKNAREILEKVNEESKKKTGIALDLMHIIDENGNVHVQQGVIVGCAGGMFENITEAADILKGENIGNEEFALSVYPSSNPIELALLKEGIAAELIEAGAVLKPAFCGPCFGAGDTPANNTLSVRHATRNFPNREGSRPMDAQCVGVALMDARSIAATARNHGILTAATDIAYEKRKIDYDYNDRIYEKRCYWGFKKADPEADIVMGPNITDWPHFAPLKEHLALKVCAVIEDEVTTTDELIPSGETSSYRSNPLKLSEFALSRRVPDYVKKAKETAQLSERDLPADLSDVSIGSCIFAKKPGDGSAREQAASSQKVLGGLANITYEYATKRYRSNCINWGILPFTTNVRDVAPLAEGEWLIVENFKKDLMERKEEFTAKVFAGDEIREISLYLKGLSVEERKILLDGCLMNAYAKRAEK